MTLQVGIKVIASDCKTIKDVDLILKKNLINDTENNGMIPFLFVSLSFARDSGFYFISSLFFQYKRQPMSALQALVYLHQVSSSSVVWFMREGNRVTVAFIILVRIYRM